LKRPIKERLRKLAESRKNAKVEIFPQISLAILFRVRTFFFAMMATSQLFFLNGFPSTPLSQTWRCYTAECRLGGGGGTLIVIGLQYLHNGFLFLDNANTYVTSRPLPETYVTMDLIQEFNVDTFLNQRPYDSN
jgi:hypothetical protein